MFINVKPRLQREGYLCDNTDSMNLSISRLVPGLIVFLAVSLAIPVHGEEEVAYKISFGFYGGYSRISGYYGGKFDNAPLYGFYAVPFDGRYLKGEINFAMADYGVTTGGGSNLAALSAYAGPLITYPVTDSFRLYCGFSLGGDYISLNAANINRQEHAYKPGFALKGGLFIPLIDRITARVSAEFSQIRVSGKSMNRESVHAGLQYNLRFFREKKESREFIDAKKRISHFELIEKEYADGVSEFNAGKTASAREHFMKVFLLNPGHREAGNYIRNIEESEVLYKKGLAMVKAGDFYGAIPLFEASSNLKPEARTELARLRRELSRSVPGMERDGISFFDRKEYLKCIELFERILLIDPENASAKIYLSRARKHQQTIEKFR